MMKSIKYITVDGRGEHESFRDCVTKVLETLKPEEGLHVIKDFEPFPMYKMMEKKGFDRFVEKINEEEYHVYFSPKETIEKIKMGDHLDLDEDKIKKIVDIKLEFLKGNKTKEQAKREMRESFETISAQEFALCEQYLEKYGISDDLLAERMDDVLEIFEGVLEKEELDLPLGHPIRTYLEEVKAIREELKKMRILLNGKFIKNQWAEVYDNLKEINTHFSRKQNQLYPALESKGFDKPSKVMWTLENDVRDKIKEGAGYLQKDEDDRFLSIQEEVIEIIEDMMVKEEEILYPTSMDILQHEDFVRMRKSDDEIGYCLIDAPPAFGGESIGEEPKIQQEFMKDLSELLKKHGVMEPADKERVHDVSQGKLTLEQINLIFKHLQVDLSYVDENEIVKFYSDTKHRVFPRSAGVIGREVQNCHPRESVDTVEEIIRAFRNGEQDEAEFWLEMGGKFIYIIYNAVRDDEGNFRGVLEMMQDVTHIRSLTGSQRLLTWQNTKDEKKEHVSNHNEYDISGETKIGELVKRYPYIKDFMVELSPKFKKLKNPVIFKTMASMADINMVSQKGGFQVNELINKIVEEIDKNN